MALLVIAIPLAIVLKDIAGGLLIVEVSVIVIAFTFTMCCLFFGIWFSIFSVILFIYLFINFLFIFRLIHFFYTNKKYLYLRIRTSQRIPQEVVQQQHNQKDHPLLVFLLKLLTLLLMNLKW